MAAECSIRPRWSIPLGRVMEPSPGAFMLALERIGVSPFSFRCPRLARAMSDHRPFVKIGSAVRSPSTGPLMAPNALRLSSRANACPSPGSASHCSVIHPSARVLNRTRFVLTWDPGSTEVEVLLDEAADDSKIQARLKAQKALADASEN